MRRIIVCAAASAALWASRPAGALTTAFVDFETTPSLPQQTSLFADAGSEQNIDVPGVATFSGGVVLGDETNLPALAYGTPPNVYGTASANYIPNASTTLSDQITIDIAPSYTVDEVSFPLFNGYTANLTYTVEAFNGANPIGQQVLSNVPSNLASGFAIVDLKATDITSVTITPSDTSGWDYSIDSVAFNEAVSDAVTPSGQLITSTGGGPGTGSATPLPPALWQAMAMLAGLGVWRLVRGTGEGWWRGEGGEYRRRAAGKRVLG